MKNMMIILVMFAMSGCSSMSPEFRQALAETLQGVGPAMQQQQAEYNALIREQTRARAAYQQQNVRTSCQVRGEYIDCRNY